MNEVNRLRARLDLLTKVAVAQAIAIAAIFVIAAKRTEPTFETIRARHVVVVDEHGVQRVHIGAPVPDPITLGKVTKRDEPASGVIIYDDKGNERGGYVTSGGNALLTLDNEKDQVVTLLAYPQGSPEAGLKNGTLHTGRIDIREPNAGTLRMVISNHAKFPGIIVRGKETKFDRPQAGMLFYNDEGSENGGLIFGGHKNDKGEVVDSGGSLSFDKYDASQIVQIAGVDDHEDKFAGLVVRDSSPKESRRRVWVGRDDAGNASIALMDAQGKKRITMNVAADGTPSIALLDAEGNVVKQIAP